MKINLEWVNDKCEKLVIVDHKDFKKIEKYLNDHFKDFLIFHNEKDSSKIVSMIYY